VPQRLQAPHNIGHRLGLNGNARIRKPFAQKRLQNRVVLDFGHDKRIGDFNKGDTIMQLWSIHRILPG
jgi:hypothetical protein